MDSQQELDPKTEHNNSSKVPRKRQKKSEVWLYDREIFTKGVKATQCLSCNKIHILSSSTSTIGNHAPPYEIGKRNRQKTANMERFSPIPSRHHKKTWTIKFLNSW